MNYKGHGLVGTISAVRRRRLLMLALRGVSISVGVGALILVLTGLAAYQYRYSDTALIVLRAGAFVGFLATLYFALLRPLLKRITDVQLARWIEERHPDLSDRFVTAVEFTSENNRQPASGAIVGRLVEDADRQAASVNLDYVIRRNDLWAYASAAVSCVMLLIGVLVYGPRQIVSGVTQLAAPASLVAPADALSITVKPGTTRVPKNSDQEIAATLVNFDADEVTFYERKAGAEGDAAQWVGRVMEPAKNRNDFQYLIFNIQDSTEYFVESNGVKSEVFKLDVVDLPYVKQINLTLDFPAYTGIATKTLEDSGDIAALRGTVAQITARLTGNVKTARVVLSNGKKIEMRRERENDLIGRVTVTRDASYHIELVSVDGETYNGSNEYDITLLEDNPPVVTFEKPGRDTKATSVEEIFTQAKAEDDYGVASIEMFFSVNGGAEQKVDLGSLKRGQAHSLSGAHTFFLEEYGLKPGDFVSYYAKARDAQSEATSDIYFIEVKPFDRSFSQAQQQGGGGGGGGGEDQNALTRRQKEIIAATFRLLREGAKTSLQQQTENYNTVALGQERLRDDAKGLVERIKRRLGQQLGEQEKYAKLVEHITLATQEMEGALNQLKTRTGKEALPPEQRALQQLLQADAIFRETQVAFGNEGGGGSGSSAQAEELADLFELELDKMKNQYETLRRERQQQAGQQKDEAQRKLEELARRQQQQLEQQQRQQRGGAANQSGGGGGNARQQQQLIDETRQTARELERLSRERRDAKLQELSRQLKQAADEMQQSQAASQSNNQNESVAQGLRALERLEQARRRLQQSQQASGNQSLGELRQQAADAAARQREITKDVESLSRRNGAGDTASEAKRRLAERKDALADSVGNLEREIEQAAGKLGGNQQKAKDGLREAASSLRRNRVADRIRQNKQNIEGNQQEAARAGERMIQENLNELAERLRSAEQNANRGAAAGGAEEALDRTRQLADNLESLRQRLGENRQQRQQSAANTPSQSGQQRGQQQGQQQGRGQQGQQPGQQRGQQSGQQPGQQPQQSGQQRSQQGGQQSGQSQSGSQSSQGQSGQAGEGQSGQNQAAGSGAQPGQGSQSGGGSPGRSGGGRTMGGASNGEDRQLTSELRERLREAEELRRQLGGANDVGRELNSVIEELRRLGSGPIGDDNETAGLLRSQVIDPLRAIEVALSERLQAKTGRGQLRLIDEGAAPDRYRKLVDEYYKRLSSRARLR